MVAADLGGSEWSAVSALPKSEASSADLGGACIVSADPWDELMCEESVEKMSAGLAPQDDLGHHQGGSRCRADECEHHLRAFQPMCDIRVPREADEQVAVDDMCVVFVTGAEVVDRVKPEVGELLRHHSPDDIYTQITIAGGR